MPGNDLTSDADLEDGISFMALTLSGSSLAPSADITCPKALIVVTLNMHLSVFKVTFAFCKVLRTACNLSSCCVCVSPCN